jgi:hypothetical protein
MSWDEPSDDFGLIERDYASEPIGTVCGQWDGGYIPRDEWPERIAEINRLKLSPILFHKFYGVPVLNQDITKYCWCYSVVAGVMNRLAFMGINDPVPHLSATAVAAVGTNFRNIGGYCTRAVQYIQDQGGVPNVQVWPNGYHLDQLYKNRPEVADSRRKNQLTEFIDFGQDLDAAISAMLGEEPIPVTFSLPWWRHAVCGLEVLDTGKGDPKSLDRYGIRFVNSYGPEWENGGFGEFYGKRMESWELVGISHVKARKE